MNMFLPSISILREQTKKIGLVLGPILFLVILFLPIDGTDNNNNNNNNYGNSSNINNSSISSETAATNTLSFSAKLVLATTFWMAAWWITEAIPIYVTALLPLILFPSLSITGLGDTAANYADRIIFLFLGGFILAKAVEKTQLHRRFALNMLKVFGTTPKYIVAAFMLVTGILSAWMSNTATTMLMLPIAAAVISQIGIGNEIRKRNKKNNNSNNQEQNHKNNRNTEKYINKDTEKTEEEPNEQQSRFGLCLMLSIAYSASIGGMATLIGTPPNAIFASLSKSMLDIDISFGQWLLIGMPISGISLIVAWFYTVHLGVKITDIKSIGREKEIIKRKIKEIGKITKDEKIVAAVFIATATAWVTRGLLWGDFVPMVDDSTIAIAAAFSIFLIPSSSPSKSKAKAKSSLSSLPTSQSSSALSSSSIADEKYSKDFTQNNNNNKNNTKLQQQKDKSSRILDWETAVTIPWGVLILIGGGLALAHAFTETGLDQWISSQLVFVENLHYILIVLVIVGLGIFFSEIVSNTATAALLIPIAVSLASSISIDPLLLMVPLTIATSYGFIMPVGTPPNAIVFGSKYVTAPKMAKAGFPLDIIGIIMVTALTTIMVPWIFGG
jgi:solute carrier family 13 (sodium-dependent dicarboxylate transporter), member 2/3/5